MNKNVRKIWLKILINKLRGEKWRERQKEEGREKKERGNRREEKEKRWKTD
jgi:hypothetical protein